MTDLQTRLREGLRAEAGRAQPHLLRELRLPPPRRAWSWRPRRTGRPGRGWALPWLAPVAAALAVLAVISAVRLTADDGRDLPRGTAPTVPPGPGPAVGFPAYYVSAATLGQARAWVCDSATGRAISKVGVHGQLPVAIAAAADDRTFIVVFRALYNSVYTTVTRLTLGAGGHPASFQKLPLKLPAGTALDTTGGGVALSPDGQTLALSLSTEPSRAAIRANRGASGIVTDEIEVVSLRTNATRTWVAAPGRFVEDLSWARGQRLAFLSVTQVGPPNDSASQVRVLDVRRPPGGLNASSKPVRLRSAGGRVQSMQVTGNGSTVVAWTRMPGRPGSKAVGPLVLADFSTRTGRQLRVLRRLPTVNGVPGYGLVYSADPSGRHLLIYSDRVLRTYTTYVPSAPLTGTAPSAPPVSTPPGPGSGTPPASSGRTSPVPEPGTGGSAAAVPRKGHAIKEAREAAFLGRMDDGRLTPLPTPAAATEIGAW